MITGVDVDEDDCATFIFTDVDCCQLYNQIANEINIQSVIADIRSKQSLENEILSFQPDIIFHNMPQNWLTTYSDHWFGSCFSLFH